MPQALVRAVPVLALLAVAFGLRPAAAATGGPDPFGYTWADTDEPGLDTVRHPFAMTDLRALGFAGDDTVIQINLPPAVFPTGFPFYGTSHTSLWLSSNGWLSFINPGGNSYPAGAPQPTAPAPNALFAVLWDDWTLDSSTPLAFAGPHLANDGYTIAFTIARASAPGVVMLLRVTLWPNGVMRVLYQDPDPDVLVGPTTSVGIENATGTIGLPYMIGGTALNGARPRADYAVYFFPLPKLDCATAGTLTCPQPLLSSTTLGQGANVDRYNCSPGTFTGAEKVFSLDLTRPSNLTLRLTGTGGRNLALFLLRDNCNEWFGCLAGGATTLRRAYLGPGRVYLVVDGATPADDGSFDIEVECDPADQPVPCGFRGSGVTAGASWLDGWDCAGPLTGPEDVYRVPFVGPGTVKARLTSPSSPDLRVLISAGSGFNGAAPSCLGADPARVRHFNAATGEYLVTVDGLGGASGSYDLAIDCGVDLVCPLPARVIDLFSPTPVLGDTTGGPSNADAYLCSDDLSSRVEEDLTGPEDVYQFTVTSPAAVWLQFEADHPDLLLLVLRDCSEGTCLAQECVNPLAPGTYYAVVEGRNGAQGTYSITPRVVPPETAQRWYDCPECLGGCLQNELTERSTRFEFNSLNYCGTGCDFALYAVVDCGTELHFPLFDVETARLSAFDVFQQSFRDLMATNLVPANPPPPAGCELTEFGTTVEWVDGGCTMSPCPGVPPPPCGGGADCRSDAMVIDVALQGAPSACGVYRLDFQSMGGFTWEALANCTADRTPQFNLYRDLCSALADWDPRPDPGIVDIVLDPSLCPSGQQGGTIEIENVGCAGVASYELSISQAPPHPPNPLVLTATVPAGSRVTIPFVYTLTAMPTDLVFTLDPADHTRECGELPAGVSCGSSPALRRTMVLPACPPVPHPAPVANTLRFVKDPAAPADILGVWVDPGGSPLQAFRVYGDGDRRVCSGVDQPIAGCPGASRTLLVTVPPSTPEARLAGAVGSPPDLTFYQVVGVSAVGGEEGPY